MTPPAPKPSSKKTPDSPVRRQARIYLNNLLGKTLLIHITDNRMFRGTFKCTDSDLNIILSETYEYRIPPNPPITPLPTPSPTDPTTPLTDIATPRWLGLVVVPGEHILRIELEEFASQVRGPNTASPSTPTPNPNPNSLVQKISVDASAKGAQLAM